MIFLIHPSVHLRTQSFDFYFSVFEGQEIRTFQNDDWKVDPDLERAEVLIFHQTFPNLRDHQVLASKNVVLVPMYDAVDSVRADQWWEYKDYRFVSFCQALTHKLERLGLRVQTHQYFPPLVTIPVRQLSDEIKVFFWQRDRWPNLKAVQKLLPKQGSVELFYRNDQPETCFQLSPNIRLTPIPWFETRAKFLEMLASCDLFIAPRRREGIGMAFLEAMACGVPVLGWNEPTMNEVIRHDQNGAVWGHGVKPPVLRPETIRRWREKLDLERNQLRSHWLASVETLRKYILDGLPIKVAKRHRFYDLVALIKRQVRSRGKG